MLDDHMLAFGSCIAGAGILVTGLLALLFRHPDAPRWTRPEIVAMLICVPVTVINGVGLGYVAFGLFGLKNGASDSLDLVVLAAVVLVFVLLWRGLQIRQRLTDYALATGGTSPSVYLATERPLVVGETPPPAPKPRAPRSSRKAA
jgi:hypothetical protein